MPTAPSAWDPRAALDHVVLDTLRAVVPLTGGVYLASIPLVLADPAGRGPVAVALLAASAALSLAASLAQRKGRILPRHAELFAGLVVLLALANAGYTFVEKPGGSQLVPIAVVMVGGALLLLSLPWVAAVCALGLATVAAVHAIAAPDGLPFFQSALAMISATTSALVIAIARIRSNLRSERIRYEDASRREQLERQERELRRAIEDAMESRERYRALFNGVPVGIYRSSPEGRILEANARAAEILGAPNVESLLGDAAPDFYVDPADRERWKSRLEADGIVRDFEARGRAADGRGFWIRDSARAIPGPDGKLLCYEGVIEDVTSLKQAEEALEATRRQVVRGEKLSALGTLVAGVAHEINNPLMYMRGNAELALMTLEAAAKEEEDAERARELRECGDQIATVLQGISRITHITRSLKVVARAEGAPRRVVALNDVVASALAIAHSRIKGEVPVLLESASTSRVLASEGDLSQVFLNLLFNATDALRDRKDAVIRVRTWDEGGHVVAEVEDNGVGIPIDEQHKLFTPFHTTKPQGTGLGLSVSYGIVADHGGALTFESEPGRGAKFRVTLPRAADGAG